MNEQLALDVRDDAGHDGARSWLALIDGREIHLVNRIVAATRARNLVGVATFATRVGNGWLYLLAALLLVPVGSGSITRCAFISAASIAISFALYPLMKHAIRRLRPCERLPSLRSSVRVLDRYSFPSGHAMTAAACGAPFVFVFANAALVVVPVCLLISWSRLALGHHYLSDVVAGTAIGLTIGCCVAAIIV